MRKINESMTAESIWSVYGSFGYINGVPVKTEGNTVTAETKEYVITSEKNTDKYGVTRQKGKIKNISDKPVTISCLMSKFLFDGGETQVYTQCNTWQNESMGEWQNLTTSVSAGVDGLRGAFGAAPFAALWSCQASRGTAFHVLADGAWKIAATRVPIGGEATEIEVEIGLNDRNLAVELRPGEELAFPDVIYYDFKNKTDMDCYKLHNYMNTNYPEREIPVLFNTWLYKFEKITFENVAEQIQAAKNLGVEYFVSDAAWFGQGDFWQCRGDWYENTEGGYAGKMKELSDLVHENGMKFGFWLEVETAGPYANILKTHSDYYFKYGDLYFFDFANPEACNWLFETVSGLLDKYNAEFIKFDFNQDLKLDRASSAYTKYYEGYRKFNARLKAAYPYLYMSNCASGGLRMGAHELGQFESFWLSDNQSVHEGIRIIKDTIKRLPPQAIERWAVLESASIGVRFDGGAPEKIISTNDATWSDVRGLVQSYFEGFAEGGPLGFSCDLNKFSEKLTAEMKSYIEKFKEERSFWKKAVCRILTDTDSMLVLQYSDMELSEIKIRIITDRIRQNSITVYPKADILAKYDMNGEIISGEELEACGIEIPLTGNYTSVKIELKKI